MINICTINSVEFAVSEIYPTRDNAQAMLDLRRKDYVRAGLPNERSLELSNPDSNEHIENQYDELIGSMYHKRMMGVFAIQKSEVNNIVTCDEKLVGFSDNREWTEADMMNFRSDVTKFCMKTLMIFESVQHQSAAMGVHELVVDENYDEYSAVSGLLLQKAVELAESREIYIPVDAANREPSIESSLNREKFQPTDKYADINGVPKHLYHRPPYVKEYAYSNNGFGCDDGYLSVALSCR